MEVNEPQGQVGMANEESYLWQVQSGAANGTRATATDTFTIKFNAQPVITTGGIIFSQEFNIRNSTPENESVGDNNNEIEDMGIDGIDIQVTGTFYDKKSNPDIKKFIQFMLEAKAGVEAVGFEVGRFGLELTNFPWFDVDPSATFGYLLNSIRWIDDGNEPGRVGFVATLRLAGALETALKNVI